MGFCELVPKAVTRFPFVTAATGGFVELTVRSALA
jgi:hypothetical protein